MGNKKTLQKTPKKILRKGGSLSCVSIILFFTLVFGSCAWNPAVETKSVVECGNPEYKILKERTLENLDITVNEWLASGYELRGYVTTTGMVPIEYMQAVVRKGGE